MQNLYYLIINANNNINQIGSLAVILQNKNLLRNLGKRRHK